MSLGVVFYFPTSAGLRGHSVPPYRWFLASAATIIGLKCPNWIITLPHYRGAMRSVPPSVECHSIGEQFVVPLLEYNATMFASNGPSNFFRKLPQCLGAVGNGTY